MALSRGQRWRWFPGGSLGLSVATLLTFLLLQSVQGQDQGSGDMARIEGPLEQANEDCGGILTDKNGTLTHSAEEGVDCTWTFKTDGIHTTSFHFTLKGEATDGARCPHYFIQILDGERPMSGFRRFCSVGSPITVRSRNNQLSVRFMARSAATEFSISASWTTECGKSFRGKAVVHSPGYPDSYEAGQQCYFDFSGDKYGHFQNDMEFTFFNLPINGNSTSTSTSANMEGELCYPDSVQVTEANEYYYSTSTTFCGSELPNVTGNVQYMYFTSGPTQQMAGYGFEATVTRRLKCTFMNINEQSDGSVYFHSYLNNPEHVPGKCSWPITVQNGSSIILLLEHIALAESTNCDSEYLMVYAEHSASDSSLLGKFCGYTSSKLIRSPSNEMLLVFFTLGNSSYPSGSGRYFSENDVQDCQHVHMTTSEGVIGWSDRHLMTNDNCLWNITVKPGSFILIRIENYYYDGQYGYGQIEGEQQVVKLKIYDGSEVNEDNLMRVVNPYRDNGFIVSTTNNAIVVLERSGKMEYTMVRLEASYSTVDSAFDRNCGGDQTGRKGTITSPNYPNPYGNMMECVWHITVDPAFFIQFDVKYTFSDSSTKYYRCGASDTLMITSGNGTSFSPTHSYACFTGNGRSTWFRTEGNQAVVKFQSDANLTNTGFEAQWHTVCNRRFYNANDSFLQSPNYPDNYSGNLSCQFEFNIVGYAMKISFEEFDLQEADSTGYCTADYFEVSYSQSDEMSTMTNMRERFCGSTKPKDLTLYPPLVIDFVTDAKISKPGFYLTYEFIEGDCGQTVFTGPTGTIRSPNFPGAYPSINCTYTIEVEPEQTVYLVFNNFSVGNTWMLETTGDDCFRMGSGWLLIAEGTHTIKDLNVDNNFRSFDGIPDVSLKDDSLFLGTFCGIRTPTPVSSWTNKVTLFFVSYYNWRARGFSITYSALGNMTTVFNDCGGILGGTEGKIVSPKASEDEKQYPNNAICEWIINAPKNERISLTFDFIDLEDSADCQQDFIEFRDGSTETDRRLDRRCGSETPPLDIRSTGSQMHIKFVTDLKNSGTGFRMKWTSFCEETFRNSYGTIQSPSDSKMCTFIIDQGEWQWRSYVVQLSFSSFKLGHNCLVVRDGGFEGAPLLGTYCGDSLPPTLTSSQNMMWIRYVNNDSDSDVTFTASYKLERITCDPVYMDVGKNPVKFSSPSYPKLYPNYMHCKWKFRADPNDKIQLFFVSFSLEPQPAHYSCRDWVKIHNGTALSSELCGQKAPEIVTSSGNELEVEFYSNWEKPFPGFSAKVVATSDELTKQIELYPHGLEKGDEKLEEKHDSIEKLKLAAKIPFGNKLTRKIWIATKGLISTKKEKGKKFELEPNKGMLCVCNTNIDTPLSTCGAGVYYQQHTEDKEILNDATKHVRAYTQYKSFTASLVLVVTWNKVPHVQNEGNKTNSGGQCPMEHSTFQLVLIADNTYTFALMIYKDMQWSVADGTSLVIGFSDGQQKTMEFPYSRKREAFNKLHKIIGNTGKKGMTIRKVGHKFSPEAHCNDWFKANKEKKNERLKAFKSLPKCPCSARFMWGNWRLSHWRDDYNVMCFRLTIGRSRRLGHSHGQECCYTANWRSWLTWGQFIKGGPHAGSATAFNPAFPSQRYDYLHQDSLAHDMCCYKASDPRFCQKYYQLRPVGECSTRIPFSFTWTWGDPHIKTLDGLMYTFNGLGEYILIEATITDPEDKLHFMLQGRTKRAETEDGKITSATVFSAFGAQHNDDKLFVGLDPETNDGFIILANGRPYTDQFYQDGADVLLEDPFQLKKINHTLVVIFDSDITLNFTITYKALGISVGMPANKSITTRGLMGNNNGIKEDDYILPDGTLLPSNLTERQAFEFGSKWAVDKSTTVMYYEGSESVMSFRNDTFEPLFLDEAAPAVREKAEKTCNGDYACVFDTVATKNEKFGLASAATSYEVKARDEVVKNTIPTIKYSEEVHAKSGNKVTITLEGEDPDADDELTYHLENDTSEVASINSKTGEIKLQIDLTKTTTVRAYARDSKGAQSPVINIIIVICLCNNHGECVYNSTTVTSNQGVYIAECDCLSPWTGDHCEEERDGCDENPCDAQQICTDRTPEEEMAADSDGLGYSCSECKDGYTKDPDTLNRCLDINECDGPNSCSQKCENLAGTFRCICDAGYRLLKDKVTCVDINECADKTDGCHQLCVNTQGEFKCECFQGYEKDVDGNCEPKSSSQAACENLGCKHACTVSDTAGSSNASCTCFNGYVLDSDGKTCKDRDECAENVCSQVCTNTDGSFACSCYAGYTMADDRRSCKPCEGMRYGPGCQRTCSCIHFTECHPVKGCICEEGWTGEQCDEDINEENIHPSVCPDGQEVINTEGSYECRCPEGYFLDADGSCQDKDECDDYLGQNTCDVKGEVCNNIPGGFFCSCRLGYTRVGDKCTDIDECATNPCRHECHNYDGSYACTCYEGFTRNEDKSSCTPKDDKADDACKDFKGCDGGICLLDQDEKPYCVCEIGYFQAADGTGCQDIDECTSGLAGCSGNCKNEDGGFKCECPAGSMLNKDGKTCQSCPAGKYGKDCTQECACGLGKLRCDKETGCVCKKGWTGKKCDKEVNLCESETVQKECQERNAKCISSRGNYTCMCDKGFRLGTTNKCEDVNECEDIRTCEQKCVNTVGGYHCLCDKGFSMDPNTGSCIDIDECALSVTNKCTQQCENTPGSYLCACDKLGYVLDNDGFTCVMNATCTNPACPTENGGCSEGTCFCNTGYELVSGACQWIDEDLCAEKVCDQLCSETPDGMSFVCSCNDGYVLNQDGKTCRECPVGKYGSECLRTCQCSESPCNHVDGSCSCIEGWTGAQCNEDIDECTTSNPCPANADCKNLQGSYLCLCEAGFFKNSSDKCEVCDPRRYGTNCEHNCECSSHATSCNSVDGSCTCEDGWEGTMCEKDIDECTVIKDLCPQGQSCLNNDGGYSCGCNVGYMLSKNNSCIDFDECANQDFHTCNQVCTNMVGSYQCSCFEGWTGNGNNCKELPKVALLVVISGDFDLNTEGLMVIVKTVLLGKLRVLIIIIKEIRSGSLIISFEAVLDDTDPDAAANLAADLMALTGQQVTINGQTGNVLSLQVGGTAVTTSSDPCTILNAISPCSDGFQCEVVSGSPSCKAVASDVSEDAVPIVPIAVGVSVGVVALVGLAILAYCCLKNKRPKTAPLFEATDLYGCPPAATLYSAEPRKSLDIVSVTFPSPVPPYDRPDSARKGNWTLED